MSSSLIFYLPISVSDLQRLVEAHQEEFDSLLNETFSEDELLSLEKMIDSIAAIYVQPLLSELSFDDFYADPAKEEEQRQFFGKCRSSLVLENLPYLESNPFQVTYLKDLLWILEEALVDRGGVNELLFKKDYLEELKKFKSMESMMGKREEKIPETRSFLPVDPIDFLILDVYKEIQRLKSQGSLPSGDELSEKAKKIFTLMKDETLDSYSLLRKSGLNAKDLDDHLEKVKFWARNQGR